jgi:hypothetical protein
MQGGVTIVIWTLYESHSSETSGFRNVQPCESSWLLLVKDLCRLEVVNHKVGRNFCMLIYVCILIMYEVLWPVSVTSPTSKVPHRTITSRGFTSLLLWTTNTGTHTESYIQSANNSSLLFGAQCNHKLPSLYFQTLYEQTSYLYTRSHNSPGFKYDGINLFAVPIN